MQTLDKGLKASHEEILMYICPELQWLRYKSHLTSAPSVNIILFVIKLWTNTVNIIYPASATLLR